MSPFNAWLFLRGLETLSLRGERHYTNALVFAQWLNEHPNVAWVNYPGLSSHTDHALAKRVLNCFGGVLTFGIAGDVEKVAAAVDNLKLCSHLANIPDEERSKGGVTSDMIRVSVGLEHINDIIHDVAQAFEHAGLRNAHGWIPSWKRMSGKWDAGARCTPQPHGGKVDGLIQAWKGEHLRVDGAEEYDAEGTKIKDLATWYMLVSGARGLAFVRGQGQSMAC